MLSTSLDIEIVKTINAIRKKDPKIYDTNVKFFDDNEEDDDDHEEDEDADNNSNKKSHKKQTYKDVLRSQLLKDGIKLNTN